MESSLIISNLNQSSIDLLEEIINNCPRGSHSFLALFNSYNHVLNEHGIDQNEEIELYDLLLKLGVVRGKDWHSRWQAVIDSQYHMSGVISEGSEVEYDDQGSRISDSSTETPGSDTRSTSTAALAAAARDTDREFPPIQYNTRSISQPATSRSLSSSVQARALARVQAQTNRVRQAEFERRQQEQEQAKKLEDFRRRELQEAKKRADETKALREMDDIADEFHDSTLRNKAFKCWLEASKWIMEANAQIYSSRRFTLLSNSIKQWNDILSKRVIIAHGIAEAHDISRSMASSLRQWRSNLKSRLKKRKEARLRKTFATIRKIISMRLLDNAFKTWRDLTVTKRADIHYAFRLMHLAFSHWKNKTINILALEERVIEFETESNERNALRYFKTWHHKTNLHFKEKVFVADSDNLVLRVSFDIWKDRFDMNRAANAMCDASRIRNGFYIWQRHLYKIQNMKSLAEKLTLDINKRLMYETLKYWHLSYKRFQFQVKKMHYLGVIAMEYWITRTQSQFDKMAIADDFHYKKVKKFSLNILKIWIDRFNEIKQNEIFFEENNNNKLILNSYQKWLMTFKNKKLLNRRSAYLRKALIERHAFVSWLAALRNKKQNVWIRKRELVMLEDSWKVWRNAFSVINELKTREQDFRKEHIEKSIASRVIKQWTEKTISRHVIEFQIQDRYNNRFKEVTFNYWLRKHDNLKKMNDLAVACKLENDRGLLNFIFIKWLRFTRASISRKKKCEELIKERKESLLLNTLESWYDKLKILQLEEVETQMLILRRERMLRVHFAFWESQTGAVPAIKFYNTRLKEVTLRIWNAQLPSARATKLAVQIDRRDTLLKWFITWKEALRIKKSRRAIARARALGKKPSTSRLRSRIISRSDPDLVDNPKTQEPLQTNITYRRPFGKLNGRTII